MSGQGTSVRKRRQLLLQIMRHQLVEQRVQIAFDEIRQIVERHFDAVIGDTVLGEVVGPMRSLRLLASGSHQFMGTKSGPTM